jgi:hypothetical protein
MKAGLIFPFWGVTAGVVVVVPWTAGVGMVVRLGGVAVVGVGLVVVAAFVVVDVVGAAVVVVGAAVVVVGAAVVEVVVGLGVVVVGMLDGTCAHAGAAPTRAAVASPTTTTSARIRLSLARRHVSLRSCPVLGLVG